MRKLIWAKRGKRLMMYCDVKEDLWTEYWDNVDFNKFIDSYRIKDHELVKVFRGYLPAKGKILDGGCGFGQWSIILDEFGYDLEAVDFNKQAVNIIKEHFPNLSVSVGDVLKLRYPNDYFDGYISMGVVEHFEEGPEKVLEEAHRVLKDGGAFLVSVPYFNPLRKIKSPWGKLYFRRNNLGRNNKGKFYQYAFSVGEFRKILRESGFRVMKVIPYDVTKGLKDEIPLFNYFRQKLKGEMSVMKVKVNNPTKIRNSISRLRKYLKTIVQLNLIRRFAGHMVLFVSYKENR